MMQPHSQFTIRHSPFAILLAGFVVQVVYGITQVGFLHPDQHFQIIEFSSYQLGEATGASHVWELSNQIRPTVQVYAFSTFVKACRWLHIEDPYRQMTLLRIVFGLALWAVFNGIAFHYFRQQRRTLYTVLLLISFSWTLPYIRTLFSSEMASSVVFFGAVWLYEIKKGQKGFGYPLLVGVLLGLSFYLRFQTAFGIIGWGLWLLLFDKKWNHLLPLALGFVAAIAFNYWLDYRFYHQWVFTPYRYYDVNIVQGKAAEFGTSSFTRYLIMLALVIGPPPLSIFLFYYSFKSVVQQYRQPLVWAVVFFILGHCLVAHKEERFLFPVLNVLPIIAGWSLYSFAAWYRRSRLALRRTLAGIAGFSIGLNVLVLVLLAFNPYSQTVEFSRKLKNTFLDSTTIYCLDRTPFETESGLPLVFYQRSVGRIQFQKMSTVDSLRYLPAGWLAVTYNDVKEQFLLLDSLHYQPVLYSSPALWGINRFLQSHHINTINDIWVLYRRE